MNLEKQVLNAEVIDSNDKSILRDLAKRQLEIANSPKNLELVELWKKHNAFIGKRPMIHIEVDTFEQEIIDPLLQCQGRAARLMERGIYHNFVNQELFNDDRAVPAYFPIEWKTYFNLFGYKIGATYAEDLSGKTLGHSFNHVISDLGEDFGKLGETTFGVDKTETELYKEQAADAFGDILPVEMHMDSLNAVPTQHIVHMMGMENMYFAMADYPEEFSAMMDRIAEDYIAYFKYLEREGFLLPTAAFENLTQGSFCFTDELPSAGLLTTNGVWGYMDSQETVGISPEMFKEMIFPCYRKIAQVFGLLSYGCCEPVHAVWECLKSLNNLRKVSISPWCNEEYMGEMLRGSHIIYYRKPSPNYLGAAKTLDEDAVRTHITKTLRAAKGCTLEITQRDVYSINHDVEKVRRYVELIRQCVEKEWL